MPTSPPDWLNAHGDATPVIDPESHVREYAERRGRDPNENCPRLVIGGFIEIMVDPMAEAVGAAESDIRLGLQGPKTIDRSKGANQEADSLRPGLRIGELDGHPIGVARIPVGGARSVMTLEELMALGARTFLIAGATGALKPGIDVGDYVIATSGLREEGASYHYQPPEHPARADGPASPRAHRSSQDQRARIPRRPRLEHRRPLPRVHRQGPPATAGTGRPRASTWRLPP